MVAMGFGRLRGFSAAASGRIGGMVVRVIVMGISTTAATAAPSPAAPSLRERNLTDYHDLQADLLERQLIACAPEEAERLFRRFVRGAELDTNGLSEEMGKVFLHLAVEDEGDIGVELFLKLKELEFPMLPRTGLEHGQDQDVLACVVREGIEHPGSLDSGTNGREVGSGQIFADGNHM
jgi:hypothetical protein